MAMDISVIRESRMVCIFSSDSRLRDSYPFSAEAGMKVVGFGREDEAHPFIAACDKFTYMKIIP
ncbi:NYN domain-containing protein [Cohnella faecalis]|uniref:hypothetical protein n=1 Tax=Cohnella faecalis TaxID=2315694 RepID=UPI0018F5BC39|nr:hypothetical protein [Cohnella faecalis]